MGIVDVAAQLGDLFRNTLQGMADETRLEEPLSKGTEEDPLHLGTANGKPIVADATGRPGAAVIAAALAADQANAQLAAGARKHAVEQVLRVDLGTRALRRTETAALARRPDLGELLLARAGGIPDVLRDYPECLVGTNDVLRLRLEVLATTAGARVTAAASAVPRPDADVLGVVKDPMDGGLVPPGRIRLGGRNTIR